MGLEKYSEDMDSYDKDYFTKVSAKTPEEIASAGHLSLKELGDFKLPTAQEIDESGIWGIGGLHILGRRKANRIYH